MWGGGEKLSQTPWPPQMAGCRLCQLVRNRAYQAADCAAGAAVLADIASLQLVELMLHLPLSLYTAVINRAGAGVFPAARQ